MSRAVIKAALASPDAAAELVGQALRGLGIHDADEVARATKMLKEGIAYYDNDVRGSQLDAFFARAGSFDAALAEVAQGYRANAEDIEAFTEALDATGDIMAGGATLDELYPEDEDQEQDPEPRHQDDPEDPHWQEDRSHLAEKLDRPSTGTTRAGWSEPVMLDKNGQEIHGALDPREQRSPDPTLVSHAMLDPGPRTE